MKFCDFKNNQKIIKGGKAVEDIVNRNEHPELNNIDKIAAGKKIKGLC